MDSFQILSTLVKLAIWSISALMVREMFLRYRGTLSSATLFLLVFQVLFTVTYLFQFLIPVLYDPGIALMEKGSTFHISLSGITFTLLVSFEALFMSLFAFDVFNPRLTKYLMLIPLCVTALYSFAYFAYGNVLVNSNGFYEWVSSPQLTLMIYIMAVFSFMPGIVFVAYSLKVLGKERKRAFLFAAGFFIIAIFVYIFDNLSIRPPDIVIRRFMILLGELLIWITWKH